MDKIKSNELHDIKPELSNKEVMDYLQRCDAQSKDSPRTLYELESRSGHSVNSIYGELKVDYLEWRR